MPLYGLLLELTTIMGVITQTVNHHPDLLEKQGVDLSIWKFLIF